MKLFHTDFSKPGPGVAPDEPRKKGIARVAEIVGRDMGVLFVAGMFALLGMLPLLAGLWFAVSTHAWLVALVAGAIGGLLAAPPLCGLADTILRSLRDEPNYWWPTYRRSWKNNWKACLLPGALFGALAAMDIFAFSHLADDIALALCMVGLVLLCGAALYVLPQIALLELPFVRILSNALLLMFKWLPRTLASVTIIIGHSVLVWLYFPFTAIEMVILGSWFPILWVLFLIYPALDSSFHIEETLNERNRQKYPEPQ